MYAASARSPAFLLVIVLAVSIPLLASGDAWAITSARGPWVRSTPIAPTAVAAIPSPHSAPVEAAAAAAPRITAISAGGFHTCALTSSGRVMCWGANYYGPLGNGTRTSSGEPVNVVGITSRITAISAGGLHTCALTSEGRVMCWGDNANSQLGNGAKTLSTVSVDVVGLDEPVRAIAAGAYHTCALTRSGGVKCWGFNHGQLGNGTKTDSLRPVDVVGLASGVIAIAAGQLHTCALMGSGAVRCWGVNDSGQLGTGDFADTSAPVAVTGLRARVTAIIAGGYHTCALTTDSGAMCWGANEAGQLGDGTRTDRNVPGSVSGLWSGIVALSGQGSPYGFGRYDRGEDSHTCALTSAGGVKCWGFNADGQLGDGTTTDRLRPADVVGLSSGIRAIVSGGLHTCALTIGGGVKCWGSNARGSNARGQLSIGRSSDSSVPVDVPGLTRGANMVRAISAGASHNCALTVFGGLKCWGNNYVGQLGNGTVRAHSGSPVDVVSLASGVTAVSSAGGSHNCALTVFGGVKCWGYGPYGQLGNRTTVSSSVPVDVWGLGGGVTAIEAGRTHTCALMSVGGVKCWGANANGQLGDRTTVDRGVPVAVSGLEGGASAIALGFAHTCALIGSAVACWGDNSLGQLGDGSTTSGSVPIGVSGLPAAVTAIAAGGNHTCALTSGGRVQCWGANDAGQLGDGTTTMSRTPVDVVGLPRGVTAISVGYDHTCALTSSGTVACWGEGRHGELGNGAMIRSLTPVSVLGLASRVSAIAAGWGHTCAMTSSGDVSCWGLNESGELGNETRKPSAVPVAVNFAVYQMVLLQPSVPAGSIPHGTMVTFSATVRPLGPAGVRPVVRFVIYRKDTGPWKLAATRDVTADASDRVSLRWGFVTPGLRYVRARVLGDSRYAASAWGPLVNYEVR